METALYFTEQERHDYGVEQNRVAKIRHKMQQILQKVLQSDAHFAEQENKEDLRHANEMADLKTAEIELVKNIDANEGRVHVLSAYNAGQKFLQEAYESEGDKMAQFSDKLHAERAQCQIDQIPLHIEYDRLQALLEPAQSPMQHHQEYQYDHNGSPIWTSATDRRNGLGYQPPGPYDNLIL